MSSNPDTTLDRPPWPQSLLELLERQHAMVHQLADLADSQAALINDSQTDRLLDLLGQRQTLIDQFTVSQNQLSEMSHGLDRRLELISAAQRDRIKSLISQIGERLAQVMRRDEQDQVLLRNTRQQIKQELSTLGTHRQARSAYVSASPSNRFADRHG